MGDYTHLSIDERQKLYFCRQQGMSISDIALQLNRDRSSLYRELARHSKQDQYDPFKAHACAEKTRHQKRICKIERYSTLRHYVRSH